MNWIYFIGLIKAVTPRFLARCALALAVVIAIQVMLPPDAYASRHHQQQDFFQQQLTQNQAQPAAQTLGVSLGYRAWGN